MLNIINHIRKQNKSTDYHSDCAARLCIYFIITESTSMPLDVELIEIPQLKTQRYDNPFILSLWLSIDTISHRLVSMAMVHTSKEK